MLALIPSPPVNGLHIGPAFIHFPGLMYVIGITGAIVITQRRWKAPGGDLSLVGDVALWAVPPLAVPLLLKPRQHPPAGLSWANMTPQPGDSALGGLARQAAAKADERTAYLGGKQTAADSSPVNEVCRGGSEACNGPTAAGPQHYMRRKTWHRPSPT